MADFPAPETVRSSVEPATLPTTAALAVYILYGIAGVVSLVSAGMAIAPLFGLVGIIGVVIAHVKRDEARGTWLESHFRWQVRTFWFALLWAVIGWIFLATIVFFFVAFAIWGLTALWIVYRVVRGFLRFNERQPMAV